MREEKFRIPMPDEHEIDKSVRFIVLQGLVKKETMASAMRSIVQQVGWRHLFKDRLELFLILFGVVSGLYSLFHLTPFSSNVENLYAAIFVLSPVLFLAFSIFSYTAKTQTDMYDVEMACKFNAYQVIAIRMLAFSVMTMVVNTVLIAVMVNRYEQLHFGHAVLLSGTSLFLFSFLLTFALQARRTKGIVMAAIAFWLAGNILTRLVNEVLYNELLLNLPLVVYAACLIGFIICYMNYLNKLIKFKQPEGVF